MVLLLNGGFMSLLERPTIILIVPFDLNFVTKVMKTNLFMLPDALDTLNLVSYSGYFTQKVSDIFK